MVVLGDSLAGQCKRLGNNATKMAVADGAVSPPSQRIRATVEYYLSDMNLQFDKFFHDKISADPEGWLEMSVVLGGKKLNYMGATKERVAAALMDSVVEVKEDFSAIRRAKNAPLPPLQERKGKGKGKGKGNGKGKGKGKGGKGGKPAGPFGRVWWSEGDPADPDGLLHALREALEDYPLEDWFVSFGDDDAELKVHLFCRRIADPHTHVRSLIMGADYDGTSPRDPEGCEHFSTQSDLATKLREGWFDAEDEDTCLTVLGLMAQFGTRGHFNYQPFYDSTDRGLAFACGVGVVTTSGFAVGFEVCLMIVHPGSCS